MIEITDVDAMSDNEYSAGREKKVLRKPKKFLS